MKASEMTNEELAKTVDTVANQRYLAKGEHAILREVAKRLRKPCSKNYKCDSLEELLSTERRKNADLLRRLKVAEDALAKIASYSCICESDHIAEDALDAIKTEGDAEYGK